MKRFKGPVWLVILAGCVGDAGVVADAGTDAGAPDAMLDATTDASSDAPAAPCNISKPFDPGVLIAGASTGGPRGFPTLSTDELTLFFNSDVGEAGVGGSVFAAQRADRASPFGAPTPVPFTASHYDSQPMLSADALELFFLSNRPGGAGGLDLFVSTRATTAAAFVNVAPLGLNSALSDENPFLRADGAEFWFSSDRPPQMPGSSDIYRVTRSSGGFGTPAAATSLNSAAWDGKPVLSADGRTIFFGSQRSGGGAKGNTDIWTATRASVAVDFGAPSNVSELNSTFHEFPGWLSTDGCRLYLTSFQSGKSEVYVATRGK